MAQTQITKIVHEYFSAYERKDRAALEGLLNEDFTFGSPHDPHLEKAAYFERCWPNSQNTASFKLRKLFEKGDEAFVLYDCSPREGAVFSNTEFFRIKGAKVSEVRVFYGSLPKEA